MIHSCHFHELLVGSSAACKGSVLIGCRETGEELAVLLMHVRSKSERDGYHRGEAGPFDGRKMRDGR